MQKKYVYTMLIILFLQTNLFSHSVVLKSIDNLDGTMEVIGELSSGRKLTGAMLRVKSSLNLKVLYENRIPKSGSLIVQIPNEPYTLILDSGSDDIIIQDGEIEPSEGFSTQREAKVTQIAAIVTLGLSLLFILLSIGLSFSKRK